LAKIILCSGKIFPEEQKKNPFHAIILRMADFGEDAKAVSLNAVFSL
jgi:hypothetical protein